MGFRKNVAEQYVAFFFGDVTANMAAEAGDAAQITAYVSQDGAAEVAATNAVTELDATNCPGVYMLEVDQTEANCDSLVIHAVSSTANVETHDVHVLHPELWLVDGLAMDSVLEAIIAVLFGVTTSSGSGTTFTKRDGATSKVAVTHDQEGNRTVSTVT